MPLPPLLQPNASHQRRAGIQEPGPRRLLPQDSESFHAARSCLGSHKTSLAFIHPFVHPHCVYIIWTFSLVWHVVPFTADLPSFPFVLQGAFFFPFFLFYFLLFTGGLCHASHWSVGRKIGRYSPYTVLAFESGCLRRFCARLLGTSSHALSQCKGTAQVYIKIGASFSLIFRGKSFCTSTYTIPSNKEFIPLSLVRSISA